MANPGEGPGPPSYLRVWTTALPPPLPLSEGLDPPLAKFLFPVSNSRRIREKVAKSIVSLKAVGVSHVWSRKKGKVERYSLTLTLFLPAFCPLLTISLLSEEPLGNGGTRPSDKWEGGRHPDSGGRAHRSPPLDPPVPLEQTKLFSEVSTGSIYWIFMMMLKDSETSTLYIL